MNRPISSRAHGMLDYPAGVALIAGVGLIAAGLLTQPERPLETNSSRHRHVPKN